MTEYKRHLPMKSMTNILLFTTLLIHFPLLCVVRPYQAIAIVPVADLIGESAQKLVGQKNIFTCYNELPLSSQNSSARSRLHQALFHEIVMIVAETKNEVQIALPNIFFQTNSQQKKNNTYWALKKNFIALETLKKRGVNLALLPSPIHYDTANTVKNQPIITLIMPFFDTTSKRTFSVGTRFTMKDQHAKSFEVYALNADASALSSITIPKEYAIRTSSNTSHEEQIKTFLKLLKLWAHHHKGFIPYVWGGCSFTHACTEESFMKSSSGISGLSWYHANKYSKAPKTGFDCTGLLSRAAQAAGLPYYFKNSTTILKNLKELSLHDHMQDGDIIWIPGHVMVISDVKKNLIIEARSYDHGWGRIHEAPIAHIFKNTPTLHALLKLCTAQKPLERINKEGKIVQQITQCKLLSLRTIW